MIRINGKVFSGNSVVIRNGKVIIDGVIMGDAGTSLVVKVEGDLPGGLSVDCGDVTIEGSVNGNVQSGTGDVCISGDVSGNVTSDVGDIRCQNVGGSVVAAVGDIHRKP